MEDLRPFLGRLFGREASGGDPGVYPIIDLTHAPSRPDYYLLSWDYGPMAPRAGC